MLDRIADALIAQRAGVALTGAGISVPSGIPDFRSEGGLWERYDIEEYGTLGAFMSHPEKVWELVVELEQTVGAAAPNPAHLALAKLERLGVLFGVITQNVDGLHQEAGSACVVEFHGNCRRLVCTSCAVVFGPDRRAGLGTPPQCDGCGRILKPDMIFFGETISNATLASAMELTRSCDVMLVVGTSATVAPAAMLPNLASAGGALLIEVNTTPTELSEACDISILGDAADFLPALADRVEERLGAVTG
ncbi:MAG: NAD-dependent deacylase [Deltaproteobacteria bacterium]|nr:NAD-dependent deacylase [Deltaproteobacteria bacterium]